MVKKVFLIKSKCLLFKFMLGASLPCSMHSYQEPDFFFLDDIPVDTRRLLSGTPLTEAIASPPWTNPGPSASPERSSTPIPNHLGGSPLNPLQFMNVFLVLSEVTKTGYII